MYNLILYLHAGKTLYKVWVLWCSTLLSRSQSSEWLIQQVKAHLSSMKQEEYKAMNHLSSKITACECHNAFLGVYTMYINSFTYYNDSTKLLVQCHYIMTKAMVSETVLLH